MKYKVCVYAISKNEEKHVDRWIDGVKEADEIYVLDTGSKDKTVKKLKKHGIKVVRKIIKPFRFDVARNESLKLVPNDTDICICLDLDEVIEKGWRKKLEKIWKKNTTRLRYNYNWSFDKNGKPNVNYYIEKMHKRDGYKWIHPVHEVLTYEKGIENKITTDEITINHYPDKNKSRKNYLSLLELSVKENPNDDRNMHYLGREYMYYKRYNDCIDTLLKHLKMENATWKDERCASMRFIARSYRFLNRIDEAKMWYKKAINEAPYLREPYVELAILEYNLNNYKNASKYFEIGLNNKKYKNYINEVFCKDSVIYDYLTICKFSEKKYAEALYFANEILKEDPENKRILENKKLFIKYLKR